ncbi:MAG: hypothetical protein R2700_15655 [Solirubrobacterales bacterium]
MITVATVLALSALAAVLAFARSRSLPRLPVLLTGVLAAIALVPSAASAASIKTGFADSLFSDPRSGVRNSWLNTAQDEGAGLIRVTVNWRSVTANSRPTDQTDPADPDYHWATLDRTVKSAEARGLDVMFLLNTAPRWAEGNDRPSNAQQGSWKPDSAAFGRFGTALATRYSGSYPDPEGGTLPAVTYYEAFNEPNLDFWLAPQFEGGKNTGPELYRGLNNALAEGVKSASPGAKIVGPALAPFGGITGDKKSRTRPIKFMRDLFCLKGRKKLKPKACPGNDRLILDIVSHHPISVTGPPTQKAFNPDDATAGDMRKITKVVRAAEKGRTVLPAKIRRPIWVSEYWYRSRPPAKGGVKLATQAKWVEQSLYIFWKAGVKMAIYNLLRDRPNDDQNAFGLYFKNGDAKPAATAFRFPFVTHRSGKRKLKVWGKAPSTGKLAVQRKRGKRWKTVKRLDVKQGKVFQAKLRLKGKQKLRASLGGERSLVWTQKR